MQAQALAAARPLLDLDEPPAFEVLNSAGASPLCLVCDHASNAIPRRLGQLGLGPDLLAQHIAWDPGAAEVARGLSARLDAALVLGGYSRLVIDLNRPLRSPESMPERSAGVVIPGNLNLTPRARAARVADLFVPYHQAVGRLLDGLADRDPLLLSIHSFSPELDGRSRPWQVGVAYARDHRLGDLMRHALAVDGDLRIGDNQPYRIDDNFDYTLPTHGEARGIAHLMIEIRQDELRTAAAVGAWVERLAAAYERIETLLPDRL
jgi:predicted N-formylglutamate amidohydrolase